MVAAVTLRTSATAAARCPARGIAAPASGQGKTTVTAALARLQARRGLQVRAFKCGPYVLDPHGHQLASGAPVHQFDPWMAGEADCAQRLPAAAQGAHLVLIEGAMGLFDGDRSAADLAHRFGEPVLAVVDARAMASTFGARAFGSQHYRPHAAANTGMQVRLRTQMAAGKAVRAECGGMLARMESITLHYSTSDSSATVVARTARPGEVPAPDSGEALYQQGSFHASYLHAWFPFSPEPVVPLFAGACA